MSHAATLLVLIAATFVAMLVVERLVPARALPPSRRWLPICLVFFAVSAALTAIVPLALASGDGSTWLGVVGFLVADLVAYGIHRVVHNVMWLWRWTHRMHHGAERVDVAGSAYFHPFDVVLQIAATALPVLVLRLSPAAAALAAYLGFFTRTFQHLNVRTPQWLGWIIQRPEAHSVHHARDVHAYNYGTFMLWDIVLGTFRNPVAFSEPAGFATKGTRS